MWRGGGAPSSGRWPPSPPLGGEGHDPSQRASLWAGRGERLTARTEPRPRGFGSDGAFPAGMVDSGRGCGGWRGGGPPHPGYRPSSPPLGEKDTTWASARAGGWSWRAVDGSDGASPSRIRLGRSLALPERCCQEGSLGAGHAGGPLIRPAGTFSPGGGEGPDASQRAPLARGLVDPGRAVARTEPRSPGMLHPGRNGVSGGAGRPPHPDVGHLLPLGGEGHDVGQRANRGLVVDSG